LLADAGYTGEPITLMAAQDLAHHKVWGDVTLDLLRRAMVVAMEDHRSPRFPEINPAERKLRPVGR
jgi:hypothetical protein